MVDADRGRRSRGAILQRHHQVRGFFDTCDADVEELGDHRVLRPRVIRGVKEEHGDLYVSGSGTLVRAMLADGLVDELHLCVYPLTRGSGPRIFPQETLPASL